MKKENLILSISLLVSNRIDTIRKCMESIRPLLEQVPSELIVVDTVGEENSDGSLAVAKEYADEIVHFDWCNDFAAARNAGLCKATGEWFLFLDDDEWFEDVTEITEFFRSGEYKNYHCATYRIRDYRDRKGSYAMGTLHRMVEREPETRFIGEVHEYLSPLRLPCKELNSFIHHYGYVFDSEEEHRKHCERNLTLLRPQFEKNPQDMRLRMQMVQECMFLKELEPEAIRLCEETFEFGKKDYMLPAFQWIMTAYVRMASRVDDWEETVKRAEKVRKSFPINAFCNLAMSIMEVRANYKLEQYDKVVERLKSFAEAREYLLSHPKQYSEQKILDIEVFLEDNILADTMKYGICSLRKAGKDEEAALWTKRRQELTGKPMLSISLLVSNRIKTIEKCMESIRPLLEQFPSELIVVDTVGEKDSDGSLAVTKRYTDHIVHFDWCDDFAAARNAGLEKAKGEWFLFLDDDEWFEDVTEIIEFFKSGEYLEYFSATYGIRNYQNMEGTEYSMAVLGRMVRIGKNTKFIGRIHETFSERFLPCKGFSAFVHHYGYVYQTEEEKQKHIERNRELLEKELKDNPMDLRYRTQMALELATYDNERALAFCEQTFALCPDRKDEIEFQWQLSLVFRLYEALHTAAEEADRTYHELKEKFGFNESAELGICFQMTRIHILKGTPEAAFPYGIKYFEMFEWLEQHPEEKKLQMVADFARYQTTESYLEMLHYSAYCAICAKEYDQAWRWFWAMPWEQENYQNEEGLGFVLTLYWQSSEKEKLLLIVKRVMSNKVVMKNKNIQGKIATMLDALKNENAKAENRPDWIKSDIKLTIGVLVSNNIKTIRNCMESLKPILEAVPSELIVVDTKGAESDGSIEIAREYTDLVYPFQWINDFAAARNVCIDHARGEWFLFVDDDEWFDDTAEIIVFFNSGESDIYGQAVYNIHNYAPDYTYTQTQVSRFVHRTPRTRFVGKVHENYNEVYAPCKKLNVFAHHTGYMYQSMEEQRQHQKRNLTLLREEFQEKGYTPTICAQMVQELLHVFDTWDEGYRFCMESIPVLVDKQGAIRNSGTQWLLVASARYFSMKGDYAGVKRQVTWLRENFALTQMADMFLSVVVAGMALGEKDAPVIKENVNRFLAMRTWLNNHPEEAVMQCQLDFGMYYTDETYYRMLHIGAICANEMREYELANSYWRKLPKENFDKTPYLQDMQVTMQGLKQLQKIRELLPMLDTLSDANQVLNNMITEDNKQGRQEVLIAMQEMAILVGNRLDEILGEGSIEVSLLEEYCEFVFKCAQEEDREKQRFLKEEIEKKYREIRAYF